MIIDAQDAVLGRMATFAAQKALRGEEVHIINCALVRISGSREVVLQKYTQKHHRGTPMHGPYFPRQPYLIVKRTVRGMLPYKTQRGRAVFARVRCYNAVPEILKGKAAVKGAGFKSLKARAISVALGEISKMLGAKW